MASKEDLELVLEKYPPKKETDISGSEDELDSKKEIVTTKVEDLTSITCAVCQSTFSDPRLLSCLHSFCKQCLSKLLVRGLKFNTIKCPLCRNEHFLLLSEGVDDLMPNTQLASKLESLLQPAPQPLCGECEEANVVSFCENCHNYLCELCHQAHKRMASFKSHLLVLPDEAKSKPKVKAFQCPKHPSEPLTVYCINCKSVICRDCGLYDHNGHKFKPALEVSDQIKRSLISNLEQLEAKLETFHSHSEEVTKVEKHVTVYPDEMKSFITYRFEELHKLLEKRKEALLQQVDTQYNDFSKMLWVEKDIVETGICKLEAGIKFAQQLAESDDKLEVAVLGSKALTSMERVNKSLSWDPKSIKDLGPLAFAAQENDFDENYIENIGIMKIFGITMSDGRYLGRSSRYFRKNYTYCIEVKAKVDQKYAVLFPQMSMLSLDCSCIREGTVMVPCTTECKQDKWEVTFQTKHPGRYTMEVILKIKADKYCKEVKTFEINHEPRNYSYDHYF
ncbi:PREDICTED: tripartite motif-containing protein 45-like [Amphimedon queenslandica]|uniref:RING-type E3 ubiquitin transferase n=1 Tax=Amphimedon queenslandica TaxID=400682 RepID=A0A1X7UIP7_AMPQE|nr:PREDICTED: tripartite motif-containing protein 45-like [Amphimedon queenslandica]|eukprot:XP_011404961.1 PREDICTED: tripartite motif-containing protein 45-like [Amphimedon queenslandica]